jgi:hypothetical protein
MNYEVAVLAALVQLEKPTKPSITEKTGISDQRVNLAIRNLRDILDVKISRIGSNKTGFYNIDSWGAFESGRKILRKARALDLDRYKNDRTIKYDTYRLKKLYSDEVKLNNYRQSLRLEGFQPATDVPDLDRLSESERKKLRDHIKGKFTRHSPSSASPA